MEESLHNVSDLATANRSAIEAIVGHPLQSSDVLYIATLSVEVHPAAQRDAAWDELESIIAEANQRAAISGFSSEQIDSLIDSASAAVRRRCHE